MEKTNIKDKTFVMSERAEKTENKSFEMLQEGKVSPAICATQKKNKVFL